MVESIAAAPEPQTGPLPDVRFADLTWKLSCHETAKTRCAPGQPGAKGLLPVSLAWPCSSVHSWNSLHADSANLGCSAGRGLPRALTTAPAFLVEVNPTV